MTELGGPERYQQHLAEVRGENLPPTEAEIAQKQQEIVNELERYRSQAVAAVSASQSAEAEFHRAEENERATCQRAEEARIAAASAAQDAVRRQIAERELAEANPMLPCGHFADWVRNRVAVLESSTQPLQAAISQQQAQFEVDLARIAEIRVRLQSASEGQRSSIEDQARDLEGRNEIRRGSIAGLARRVAEAGAEISVLRRCLSSTPATGH